MRHARKLKAKLENRRPATQLPGARTVPSPCNARQLRRGDAGGTKCEAGSRATPVRGAPKIEACERAGILRAHARRVNVEIFFLLKKDGVEIFFLLKNRRGGNPSSVEKQTGWKRFSR